MNEAKMMEPTMKVNQMVRLALTRNICLKMMMINLLKKRNKLKRRIL